MGISTSSASARPASPTVTVHDPVPPDTLPTVLNQYDLGVFLYPLRTLSHRFHLPNKFFDFVQARLGLVFSPAPEIDAHIAEYGIGIITADTTADALVDALRDLTRRRRRPGSRRRPTARRARSRASRTGRPRMRWSRGCWHDGRTAMRVTIATRIFAPGDLGGVRDPAHLGRGVPRPRVRGHGPHREAPARRRDRRPAGHRHPPRARSSATGSSTCAGTSAT